MDSYPGARGSRTSNAAPGPGRATSRSSPPCRSTILRAMASPRPAPSFRPVANGSKRRSRSAGSIPAPVVPYLEEHRAVLLDAPDVDPPRARLGRVLQEVREHLPQPRGIDADGERRDLEPDVHARVGAGERPGGILRDDGGVHVHRSDRRLAREIEEVVGEPPEPLDLAEHVLERLAIPRREHAAAALAEELHRASDDAERVADLVGHHGAHARERIPPGRTLRARPSLRLRARPVDAERGEARRAEHGDEHGHEERATDPRPRRGERLARLERQHRARHPARAGNREVPARHRQVSHRVAERDRRLAAERARDPLRVHAQEVRARSRRARRVGEHEELGREHVDALERVRRHDRAQPLRRGRDVGEQLRGDGPRAAKALLEDAVQGAGRRAMERERRGEGDGEADGCGDERDSRERHYSPSV